MKIKVKPAPRKEKDVFINTDFIRLDSFLKFTGTAMTGGQAKAFILDGIVKVNSEVCLSRGKKLRSGDTVSVFSTDYHIKNEN